jgi:hypothetical protein
VLDSEGRQAAEPVRRLLDSKNYRPRGGD